MMPCREELDSLLAYGIALVGNRDEGFELLQACIEKYLRLPPAEVQHPVAYLRRMMRNRFIDDQRWHHRWESESYDDELHSGQDDRDLETMLVNRIAIETVWKKMTAAEREIVHLWALEGLSAAEIALQLGIPRGTVLSRLHRVRQRLSRYHHEECNQKHN